MSWEGGCRCGSGREEEEGWAAQPGCQRRRKVTPFVTGLRHHSLPASSPGRDGPGFGESGRSAAPANASLAALRPLVPLHPPSCCLLLEGSSSGAALVMIFCGSDDVPCARSGRCRRQLLLVGRQALVTALGYFFFSRRPYGRVGRARTLSRAAWTGTRPLRPSGRRKGPVEAPSIARYRGPIHC